MSVTTTATIDQAALQRVLDALEELAQPPPDLIRLLGDGVAQDGVMPRITNYPPRMYRAQPFVSDKQRRAFFAMLRSGAITVPYSRTYALRAGWRPIKTADGAEVRNDVPYAGMVMGDSDGQQSAYFAGKGWLSTTRIASDVETNDVPWIGEAAVTLWILKRGLG